MAPGFASSPNQTQYVIQPRRIRRDTRRWSRTREEVFERKKREEEIEGKKRRMLEESSADFATKLRWRNMKPRRFRTMKLDEEEMRMIEDKETEILVGLPRQERVRLEDSSYDFASSEEHHCILIHDSSKRLPGSAPPGSFNSVVFFSSFSSFVVGSVNGLICIAGRLFDTRDDIWILNPLTGLYIKLPPPASPTIDDHAVSFAFCCLEEEDSYYYYCKVFKVVCVSEPYPPHLKDDCDILVRPVVSNHVEVWDSRSPHEWTKIENVVFPIPFYHPGELITSCDIIIGKVAYWIVSRADGLDLDLFLLSINMETHAVNRISLPKESKIPLDFLIGKLIFRLENTFLFGAIWEGSFALLERLGFETMLYNVWVINDESGGAPWIKKTTFLVDFGFQRFISCINGKLLVEQDRCLKVLFDMETRRGEVIKVTNTFVDSAHHFVGSILSVEGFKSIRSFPNSPEFTIVWPNRASSASEDASGERAVGAGQVGATKGNTSTGPAPGKFGSKKSSPAQIGASKGNTSTGPAPGKSGSKKPSTKLVWMPKAASEIVSI